MKKWMYVIPILIIIFIFFMSGYRFSALGAAKSNAFLADDAELLEKYDTGPSAIYIFKSDKEMMYRTVLSEKSGLIYHSPMSTYIPYTSDKIQTVGAINYATENDAATLISVVSYDEEVAYIEVGVKPNIQRKEIDKGERITFFFAFSEQVDHLHPTAYNADGKKLYYYGYPKGTNVLKPKEIRWHKIDEQ